MPPCSAARRQVAACLALLLAAGCAVPTSGPERGTSPKPSRSTPQPSATPGVAASTRPDAPAAYFGRVLGLDGKPAADVLVRGFLVSDQGAGVIANNGAGIVSNNSGALVGSNGAAIAAPGAFRLAAASGPLATRTAADGTFAFANPDGRPLNVEAEADAQTKAIRLEVPAGAQGVELQLAPTGTLAGTVVAEAGSGVTNLVGVDVFIPGTSYLAKTDEAGRFTIANVPAGTFRLLASKVGLGEGVVAGVVVRSREATQAPPIALVLARPAVKAVDRPGGAPGTPVRITGEHFGATAGAPFEVTFGGAAAGGAVRKDDRTIEVPVPEGARTGDLFVAVNGVPGVGLPFEVYKTLALPMGLRDLGLGQVQAWTAGVLDTSDRPVAAPAVSWAVEGAALEVGPDGTLTPRSAGSAVVRATSGKLSAGPVTIRVHDAPAVVATLAGGKQAGFVDGLGLDARFTRPEAIGVTPAGELLVLDNASLRLVRVRGTGQGRVTTVAGNGVAGVADGEGATAQLLAPKGVYAGGKVFLVDTDGNDRSLVRLAEPRPGGAWAVRTIAGGATGYAEGPGADARFRWPTSLAVDGAGHVYVADRNHRIRKLTPAADGTYTASTLVGDGTPGKADGVGGAASLGASCQLALAGPDAIWVLDEPNRLVRRVALAGAEAGALRTVAGSGERAVADGTGAAAAFRMPTALATDPTGNAYVFDYPDRIARITPAGAVTTFAPAARALLGVDAQGRVYGQTTDFRLVRWDAAGQATVLAGTGALEAIDGAGPEAAMQDPLGFVADADGLLYVSEYADYGDDHRIRRVWVRP